VVDDRPVTVLLRAWSAALSPALDALVPIVYAELRRLAAAYVSRERPGRTLTPTDLVSEAYGRLATEDGPPEYNGRAHFFAVAARHMRQILVDRARRRGAAKRNAGERPVTFDDAIAADGRPEDLLALDEALTALAAADERKARAIEMHYFSGMTHDEIATVLGASVSTVQRELRVAEAWLHQRLREP
jgi:RNA polymerase sigma factor (TIGR02999 family)